MRDNCVQVAKKLPVIYYYIIIPTTYNFDVNMKICLKRGDV